MSGRVAMVSIGVRRDLLAPMRHFRRHSIIHLYHHVEGPLALDRYPTLRRYRSPRDLYRLLRRARPDIVQAVEPFSVYTQPYVWACAAAAAREAAALVVVGHQSRALERKFGRLGGAGLRSVLRPIFARAALVAAVNDGAVENFVRCGVPRARIERLSWGTWGVDLDEFAPRPAGSDRPPTIAFGGRLRPEKGVFVLLAAFEDVVRSVPQARLTLVGDGPARRALEEDVARRRLTHSVTIGSALPPADMPALFRSADVVAVPSLTTRGWSEHVGMVAVQALACGVPVVASRSGALPEYVPDGVAGLLVPEGDAQALAGALTAVLTDDALRSRLAAGARAHAVANSDERSNIALIEERLAQLRRPLRH